MDYEKKYKEANDKVAVRFGTNVAKEIFTDLYESEDERIRRAIIDIIKSQKEQQCHIDSTIYDEMIAWLEKQGEQKDFVPKEEPKFKVGDWIVSKYMHLIMQILNNDNGSYKTVETDGTERNDSYDFIERNFKLWSIEDTKDGDVLVEDSCTFIIQELYNNNTLAKTYCTLYDDGDFDDDSTLSFDVNSTHPATKEQCNTLFSKMKESGYEWDDEKKELKKISQRMISAEAKEALYDKLAWSEEDDYNLQCIIAKVTSDIQKGNVGRNQELIDWLKSLKERIGG